MLATGFHAQSVPAAIAVSDKPVVDTGPTETKRPDDLLRAFSILNPLNRPNTDFFHYLGIYFSAFECFHVRIYSKK